MKLVTALARRMAALPLLALIPAVAPGCDQISAGQPVWVRLTAPVSTYTAKPGDAIQAVLTEAIKCDNETSFAVGTPVTGVVRSVRKVGWGIMHETAALGLNFNELRDAEGRPVTITTSLTEVENAREQVSSKGMIQGIRSSDTPEGRINSRLRHLPTWNPYSDLGLIVYKATFPIFPEPEIYLPAGADLKLKLNKPVAAPEAVAPLIVDTASSAADNFEWQELVRAMPVRSTTLTQADADLINLAFVGSREQIADAFRSAGWVNSDVFTKKAFTRTFYAFLNNSGYAQAPMRPFLLSGNPSSMNWQKSLNSYARRDHLRIWEWNDPVTGKMVWLAAATHDTSAALSLKHRQFVHHISPEIDEERSKVIRDLNAAGCVQWVHLFSRPGVPTLTQTYNGDPVMTDGALAVVELKDCQSPAPELAQVSKPVSYKPGNKLFRYFRRQILTFRSDIWRANIIYGAYDLGHMSFNALKHRNSMNAFQRKLQQANESAKAGNTSGADSAGSSAVQGSQ
jgi:hypothetical protein